MSYPPLPSNGEINWGNKFRTWADAIQGGKVEGEGMALRYDTSVGSRVFLDRPWPTMLWGDTGLRSITHPDIISGWMTLSRTDSMVYLAFDTLVLAGSGSVTIQNIIPTGFRPLSGRTHYDTTTAFWSSYQEHAYRVVGASGNIEFRQIVEGQAIQGSTAWSTPYSWPEILPGTPL